MELMKKFLKVFAWAATAALLLAATGAIAARLYFTPARLKAMASAYAESSLHRQVSFGSIGLTFSGITVSGLRVSERPDFSRGEFLKAGEFSARPSLASLLRGKVTINSVSASGLSVKVRQLPGGTYNFSDLLSSGAGAGAGGGKAGGGPRLSVSSLKVSGSSFFYANSAGDLNVTMKDINLEASDLSPSGLFPVRAGFTLNIKSPYFTGEVPARISGKADLGGFNPAKGKAEISEASVRLNGIKVSFKGSLSGLLEPDAKLSLSIAPFSTTDLARFFKTVPRGLELPVLSADTDFKFAAEGLKLRSAEVTAGPVRASISGNATWSPRFTYSFEVKASAKTPAADSAALRRFAPVPPGLKLPASDISAAVRIADGRAAVRAFSLNAGQVSANGTAVADFSGKALRASGVVNAAVKDLAELAAAAPDLAGPYLPSGSARAALAWTYAGKPAVKGRAELLNVGASFSGEKLSGLSGAVDFTADSAAAGKLLGKLDGAPFTGSFSVSDALVHPRVRFTLDLARLSLPELPASAASPAPGAEKTRAPAAAFYADIAGSISLGAVTHPNFNCGKVSARLDLKDVSADMRRLSGTASFETGPGKLSGLYKLAQEHKTAKVALYPLLALQKASKLVKALRLPDFDNVDFDSIQGAYSFNNGLMKLDKSLFTAPVADVSSSGSIDLPAEKLDMKTSVKLKAASGVRMGAPVSMLIGGTFDQPSVKLDLKSLVEQPAVKEAVEKLAPKAEKLLKGLFGR